LKDFGSVDVFERDVVDVEVGFQKEFNMKGIEIDANRNCVKVKSASFACQVTFLKYEIEDANIGAKWIKAKKKLVISCPKKKGGVNS
jgi:hypothetical protein